VVRSVTRLVAGSSRGADSVRQPAPAARHRSALGQAQKSADTRITQAQSPLFIVQVVAAWWTVLAFVGPGSSVKVVRSVSQHTDLVQPTK
jgi:hypothetical protein